MTTELLPLYPTPKITDHETAAVARLTDPFIGKPRIVALAALIGDRAQSLENVLYDVLARRMLGVFFDRSAYGFDPSMPGAEGTQLDVIGKILGLPRVNGQTDDSYRRDLGCWYLFLQSCGEPETLIAILAELTQSTAGGVHFREFPPASMMMYFDGSAAAHPNINSIMQRARLAGVRLDLVSTGPETAAFCFEGGVGLGFDQGQMAVIVE
jgi:hypothetical protein